MNLRYRALRARSENEEFRIEKVLGWSVGAPKPLLSKFLILNSKLERSRASALVPFLSHYVRHLSPFWGKRAANVLINTSLLILKKPETTALRNLRYRALRARIENEEFRIEKVLGWSVGAPQPLLSKFLILNSKLERSRASALVPFLSHYVRHLSPFWGKRAANALLNIGLLILEKPETTALRNLPYRFLFLDRKSTRLNSSHVAISYAVFCLKKK